MKNNNSNPGTGKHIDKDYQVMRFSVRRYIHLVMFAVLLVHCGGSNVKNTYNSIPDHIVGWKTAVRDIIYDRESLFDYMNGGAEVYLAFDFQHVFVRKYQKGDDELILDIYDMGSPAEAFGVFSCDREDEEAGIGQGSEYGYGMLRFWKGSYFVSIITTGDYQVAEEAILELGKAVSDHLGPEGAEPVLLGILPKEGLRRETISYFHSNINLNNRFFIASENILNLENDTDCVFAEFGSEDLEIGKLLIVQYPDEVRAEMALESFLEVYIPEAGETGIEQMEDGRWTVARRHNQSVAIVFDAPDRDTATRLQSEINFN